MTDARPQLSVPTAEQVPDGFAVNLVRVNGRPGLLATVNGTPQSVWFFHVRGGRIQNAYAVLNPDKLRHVDPEQLTGSPDA